MENKDVPYIVYESAMSRAERTIRRLTAIIVLAILLIVASNAGWIWYINQYEFMTYEYEQDGRGINIIGDSNGVDHNGSAAQGDEASSQKEG